MKKWLLVLTPVVLIAGAFVVFMMRDKPTPKTESSQTPNPTIGVINEVSEQTVVIKTDVGKSVTFSNGVKDVPVEHLKEHQTDKEPVSVTWRAEGNQKIATQIDDAP